MNNKDEKNKDQNAPIKPDPETLNTTDPQEHMEGPISSLVQGAKKEIEKDDQETGEKK